MALGAALQGGVRRVVSAVTGNSAGTTGPPNKAKKPGGRRPQVPARRGPQPIGLILGRSRRKRLERDARRRGLSYGIVVRARIILALSRDPSVSAVARNLGVDPKTVRHWRDRYLAEGRKGLKTRPRSGRPSRIDPATRCEIIGMACGKPSDFDVAFRSTWTIDALLETFRRRNPDREPLSRSSVQRILNLGEIRPHRMRVWLHSPDPLFREKTSEICKLYIDPPPGSVVLCIDEKTGMQALSRKHPTRQPQPGKDGREDFEYKRNGTRTLIAAFNPHSGDVYGEVHGDHKIPTMVAFMESVAERYPDQEVHVVWDNLNTHLDGPEKRWIHFNERQGGRFHFHYTPIHASWVNQVENFFAILARRVLRYASYSSTKSLTTAVLSFLDHWNDRERHPFNWTFQGYPVPMVAAAGT